MSSYQIFCTSEVKIILILQPILGNPGVTRYVILHSLHVIVHTEDVYSHVFIFIYLFIFIFYSFIFIYLFIYLFILSFFYWSGLVL